MTPVLKRIAALVLLLAVGVGLVLWSERFLSDATSGGGAGGAAVAGARALQWNDLLPDSTVAFRPPDAASDFPEIASAPVSTAQGRDLTDPFKGTVAPANDPHAPRADLAGERVAIAGYMTPLMVEGGETRTFLLVPYVGACIHVPAPPPNQIVLVEAPEPIAVREMWEPFQAVGTLHVETIDTGLAEVGYTMELERIEPYQEAQGPLEGVRSAGDGD